MGLSIIGVGVLGTSQLTLEGLRAIRQASKVLSWQLDPDEIDAMLRELGVPLHDDISALYRDGDVDQVNYDRIFARIVDEVSRHGSVALLLPGHPRVGVTLTRSLEAWGRDHGHETRVIVAPSSFDTMINDLGIDPLERGALMVDANRLLLFDYALDPALHTFIYHICSVGTARTHFSDPLRDNRIDLLQAFLLKSYPADHEVVLVSSACSRTDAARMVRFPLGQLTAEARAIDFGTTLFVPACRPRTYNRNFFALIDPGLRPRP